MFVKILTKIIPFGLVFSQLYLTIAHPLVVGANLSPIASGCGCSDPTAFIIGNAFSVTDQASCISACEADTLCLSSVIDTTTMLCYLYKPGCVFVESDTSLCSLRAGYAPPIRQSGVCSHIDVKGNDNSIVGTCREYSEQASCELDTNCFYTEGPTAIRGTAGCFCSNQESIATQSNSYSVGKSLEECHMLCQSTSECVTFYRTGSDNQCYLQEKGCDSALKADAQCYYKLGYEAPSKKNNACTHKTTASMLNVGLCKQLDSKNCDSNQNCMFNPPPSTPTPVLNDGNCDCADSSEQLGLTDNASSFEKCNTDCNSNAGCVYFAMLGESVCQLYKGTCQVLSSLDHKCYYKSSITPPSSSANQCTHQFAAGSDASKVANCKGLSTETSCSTSADCQWIYDMPPKILPGGCKCDTSSDWISFSSGDTEQSCLQRCKSTNGCQMFSISTSPFGTCYLSPASCAASSSAVYNCYYLPGYEAPATTENTCTHTSSKSTDSSTIATCKALTDEGACSQNSGCDWVLPPFTPPSTTARSCTHTAEKGKDSAKIAECKTKTDADTCSGTAGCEYNYVVCQHFDAPSSYTYFADQSPTAEPGQVSFIMPELSTTGECRIMKIEMVEDEANAADILKHPAVFNGPVGCGIVAVACPKVDVSRKQIGKFHFQLKVTQQDGQSYQSIMITVIVKYKPVCQQTLTTKAVKDMSWDYINSEAEMGIMFQPNQSGVTTLGVIDFALSTQESGDCEIKQIQSSCWQYVYTSGSVKTNLIKLPGYSNYVQIPVFTEHMDTAIEGHIISSLQATIDECKAACLAETSFTCKSIDHTATTNTCNLSDKAMTDPDILVITQSDSVHLERSIPEPSATPPCDEEMILYKGTEYRGCQAKTQSGKQCQAWNTATPQTPDPAFIGDQFDTAGSHNHCRNPEPSQRETIWCYTTDLGTSWEYCEPLASQTSQVDDTYTKGNCESVVKYPSADSTKCPPGSTEPCKSFQVDLTTPGLFLFQTKAVTENGELVYDKTIHFVYIATKCTPFEYTVLNEISYSLVATSPSQLTWVMPELSGTGDCKIEKILLIDLSENTAENLVHPAVYNSPSGCGIGAVSCPTIDVKKSVKGEYTFKIQVTQADGNIYTTSDIQIVVTSNPLCATSFSSQVVKDPLSVWKQFSTANSLYSGIAATKDTIDFVQAASPIQDCRPKSISLVCKQYFWEDCFQIKYEKSSCGGDSSGESKMLDKELSDCAAECKKDPSCLEFQIDTGTNTCTLFTGTCSESPLSESESQQQFIYQKEAECSKQSLWSDSWTTTGSMDTALAEITTGNDSSSRDCGSSITYPSSDISKCPENTAVCMSLDVDRSTQMFFYLKFAVVTQNDETIEDLGIHYFQVGQDNQLCVDPVGLSQSETIFGGPPSRVDPGRVAIALPLLTNTPANKCNYRKMELSDLPADADKITYPATYETPIECQNLKVCPFVDFKRDTPALYSFKITVTDFFFKTKTFGPITVEVKPQTVCQPFRFQPSGYAFSLDATATVPEQLQFTMDELNTTGDCQITNIEITNKGGDADAALTHPGQSGTLAACQEASTLCPIIDVSRTTASDSTFKVKVTQTDGNTYETAMIRVRVKVPICTTTYTSKPAKTAAWQYLDDTASAGMLFVPTQGDATNFGRVDLAPSSPEIGDCELTALEMECFKYEFEPTQIRAAAAKLRDYGLSAPVKTPSGPDYSQLMGDALLKKVACSSVYTYPPTDAKVCPQGSTSLCMSIDLHLAEPGLFLVQVAATAANGEPVRDQATTIVGVAKVCEAFLLPLTKYEVAQAASDEADPSQIKFQPPGLAETGDCKITKLALTGVSDNAAGVLIHPAIFGDIVGCGLEAATCPVVDVKRATAGDYKFKVQWTRADSISLESEEITVTIRRSVCAQFSPRASYPFTDVVAATGAPARLALDIPLALVTTLYLKRWEGECANQATMTSTPYKGIESLDACYLKCSEYQSECVNFIYEETTQSCQILSGACTQGPSSAQAVYDSVAHCKVMKVEISNRSQGSDKVLIHPAVAGSPAECTGAAASICPFLDVNQDHTSGDHSFKVMITQKDGFTYESDVIQVPIIHVPICVETFKSATTKDDSWNYLYPDTKTGIIFEKAKTGAATKGLVDFSLAAPAVGDCAVVAYDYVCYQYKWKDCYEMKYDNSLCGGSEGSQGTEILITSQDAGSRLTKCSEACQASVTCQEFFIDQETGKCTTFTGSCDELAQMDGSKQVWKKLAVCKEQNLYTDSWTTHGTLLEALASLPGYTASNSVSQEYPSLLRRLQTAELVEAELLRAKAASSNGLVPDFTTISGLSEGSCRGVFKYPPSDAAKCQGDTPCQTIESDLTNSGFFIYQLIATTANGEAVFDQNPNFLFVGTAEEIGAPPILETHYDIPGSRTGVPGRVALNLPLLNDANTKKSGYSKIELLNPSSTMSTPADLIIYPATLRASPECAGAKAVVCPFIDLERQVPGTITFEVKLTNKAGIVYTTPTISVVIAQQTVCAPFAYEKEYTINQNANPEAPPGRIHIPMPNLSVTGNCAISRIQLVERDVDSDSLMVVYPVNCNETLSGVNGSGYRGCQSKTISGRTCQAWEEQTPHTHAWVTVAARESEGLDGVENNYCRNPDAAETIWCYTTDPERIKESCQPLDVLTPSTSLVAINPKCEWPGLCPLIDVNLARIASTQFKIKVTQQDGSLIMTLPIKVNVIFTCTGKPLSPKQLDGVHLTFERLSGTIQLPLATTLKPRDLFYWSDPACPVTAYDFSDITGIGTDVTQASAPQMANSLVRYASQTAAVEINADGFPALKSNTGATYELNLVGLVTVFGREQAQTLLKLTINEPFTCDDDPVGLVSAANLVVKFKRRTRNQYVDSVRTHPGKYFTWKDPRCAVNSLELEEEPAETGFVNGLKNYVMFDTRGDLQIDTHKFPAGNTTYYFILKGSVTILKGTSATKRVELQIDDPYSAPVVLPVSAINSSPVAPLEDIVSDQAKDNNSAAENLPDSTKGQQGTSGTKNAEQIEPEENKKEAPSTATVVQKPAGEKQESAIVEPDLPQPIMKVESVAEQLAADLRKFPQIPQAQRPAALPPVMSAEKLKSLFGALKKQRILTDALKPTAKARALSRDGVLKLVFAKALMVPPQLRTNRKQKPRRLEGEGQQEGKSQVGEAAEPAAEDDVSLAAIDVQDLFDITFVMKSDVDPISIEYFLQIKEWSPAALDIWITFKEPQLVSMGNERDTVFISFKDPTMLRSEETGLPIENVLLKQTLPRQLPRGVVAEQLEEQAGAASAGISAVVIVNIAIRAFTNNTFVDMLSWFYCLQLCCYFTFYEIRMPANIEIWLDHLRRIINFSALSPDSIMDVFGIDQTITELLGVFSDQRMSASNESTGLKSTSLIVNHATYLAIIAFFYAGVVVLILAKVLSKGNIHNTIVGYLKWLKARTLFGGKITALTIGYLRVVVCFTVHYESLDLSNFWRDWREALPSLSPLLLVLGYPILVVVFLRSNRARLHEPVIRDKFGQMYEGVVFARQYAVFQYPAFLLRRFAFVLIVVLFKGYPCFQVQFLAAVNVAHSVYYISVRPQGDFRRFRTELSNECAVLLLSYHMFLFTPFVPQQDTQFSIGYSFIGVITYVLVSNTVNISHNTYTRYTSEKRRKWHQSAYEARFRGMQQRESLQFLAKTEHETAKYQEFQRKIQERAFGAANLPSIDVDSFDGDGGSHRRVTGRKTIKIRTADPRKGARKNIYGRLDTITEMEDDCVHTPAGMSFRGSGLIEDSFGRLSDVSVHRGTNRRADPAAALTLGDDFVYGHQPFDAGTNFDQSALQQKSTKDQSADSRGLESIQPRPSISIRQMQAQLRSKTKQGENTKAQQRHSFEVPQKPEHIILTQIKQSIRFDSLVPTDSQTSADAPKTGMSKIILDPKEKVKNSQKLKQTEPMGEQQRQMAIVEKVIEQRQRIKLLGSILLPNN